MRVNGVPGKRTPKVRCLAPMLLAALAATATASCSLAARETLHSTSSQASTKGLAEPVAPACSPSASGVLAESSASDPIQPARDAGYMAVPLEWMVAAVVQQFRLVFVYPTTQADPTEVSTTLSRRPGIVRTGLVLSPSSTESLSTCSGDLTDKPSAAHLASLAASAATAQGDLSGTPIYQALSDDPFDSMAVLVTLDVDGPVSSGVGPTPAFGGPVRSTLRTLVLITKSGTALAVSAPSLLP